MGSWRKRFLARKPWSQSVTVGSKQKFQSHRRSQTLWPIHNSLHMLLICFTGTEGKDGDDGENCTEADGDRELREIKETWEEYDKTMAFMYFTKASLLSPGLLILFSIFLKPDQAKTNFKCIVLVKLKLSTLKKTRTRTIKRLYYTQRSRGVLQNMTLFCVQIDILFILLVW